MKYLSVDSRVIQHSKIPFTLQSCYNNLLLPFKTSKGSLANSLLGLLQSLLWQLIKQEASNIYSVYAKYDEKKQYRCGVHWSRQELEPVLLAVLKRSDNTKVCLFIDALDEFKGKDVELRTFLDGFSRFCSQNIRICIATRASFVYPSKTFIAS